MSSRGRNTHTCIQGQKNEGTDGLLTGTLPFLFHFLPTQLGETHSLIDAHGILRRAVVRKNDLRRLVYKEGAVGDVCIPLRVNRRN